MNTLQRQPVKITEALNSYAEHYDLVLVALGFEERSRAFAETFQGQARTKFAIGFNDRHVLSYQANRKCLCSLGYEVLELGDNEFLHWWTDVLISVFEQASPSAATRICIDISSQTRARLALIIQGLCTITTASNIVVDFVYSLAEFSAPSNDPEFAAICGPVTPFFAGWPADPDMPAAAIIGLGYEAERAIGAYEYLEPTARLVLLPQGQDARYDRAVERANTSMLRDLPLRERFTYRVDRPVSSFQLIESLTYGLIPHSRVILLPFGPKLLP